MRLNGRRCAGAPIEVVQFIYVGMIVDDSAVPDGPNTLPEYTSVLVALYLIEAVSSSSQLIVTMMVGEKIAVRLRRSVFQSALRQVRSIPAHFSHICVCVRVCVRGREGGRMRGRKRRTGIARREGEKGRGRKRGIL